MPFSNSQRTIPKLWNNLSVNGSEIYFSPVHVWQDSEPGAVLVQNLWREPRQPLRVVDISEALLVSAARQINRISKSGEFYDALRIHENMGASQRSVYDIVCVKVISNGWRWVSREILTSLLNNWSATIWRAFFTGPPMCLNQEPRREQLGLLLVSRARVENGLKSIFSAKILKT